MMETNVVNDNIKLTIVLCVTYVPCSSKEDEFESFIFNPARKFYGENLGHGISPFNTLHVNIKT